MASLVLKDCIYWVDQYDLTTDINQHSLTADLDTPEATTFGNSSKVYRPGLLDGTMTHNGYFDSDGSAESDDALFSNTTLIETVTPATATEGDVAWLVQGIQGSYVPWEGSVGDMAGFTVTGQGNITMTSGVILHPKTARTSSSNTTGVNVGSIAAGGTAYAALHVFSGTASTLDVIIQSDSTGGFGTPTNQITFTQATGATSEWASVAGAVTDTWWRVNYTVGGGTWTFGVSFGISL